MNTGHIVRTIIWTGRPEEAIHPTTGRRDHRLEMVTLRIAARRARLRTNKFSVRMNGKRRIGKSPGVKQPIRRLDFSGTESDSKSLRAFYGTESR